jgi:formylglycine-generating enzyme required for sulfatase activity
MSELTSSSFHLPTELPNHLDRRNCVLFVGDALDAEGLQSARLASALVDACSAHSVCPVSECQAGKCARPDSCAVPLTRAAQLYEGLHNRHALVDFVIRHVDNDSPPGPVHQALAKLPVRVIVTTAYNDQLEEALRLAGRSYRSVVRDTHVPFDDPEHVQLIRLHGTISQPDSLVLTEDDAADLFARLPTVTTILQGHFASKTLLFVGYQLSDPHFLALYRQVTGPIARYQRLAYAVQWPPDSLAVIRWRGKVTLIEAEPLMFLEELRQSIRDEAAKKKKKKKRAALPPEPYKFLDYYTREDAAIFFGRDLEAGLLLSTIMAHNLTVFYGRSGIGKTSLLLVRIIHDLEEKGYQVAYARMLSDPTSEVKAAVRRVRVDQLACVDHDRHLYDVLVDALPPGGRLVLVLDQYEEVFLRQGEAVRRAFTQELADCLRPAMDERAPDLRFVLSLRDDYLGAMDELSDVLPRDVFAHRYKLETLTRGKALQAILNPAEAFGLPIEQPLREQLIDDLEDQGVEPANLQIVLYRLYRDAVEQGLWSEDEKQGTGLMLARYRALGGTREILASYLDEVVEGLGEPERQRQARAILKSMVKADRTAATLSGRAIAHGDLVAQLGLGESQLGELLAYLQERRVVRKFGDEDRYELAHEVMVEKVWAWVSEEELRILHVHDMLRGEMSYHEKFGHLLTKERLELVTSCCEALALNDAELELLFRSALAAEYEVPYWRDRAPAVVGKVERELFDDLSADNPVQAQQAVSTLAALAAPSIIKRLADLLEADFTLAPSIWVDHRGKRREVRRTALNLTTPRQRRALMALTKMALPEATGVLGRWTPPGMILIPTGPFDMGGTKFSDEGAEHQVWLNAFWIDRYPVTNGQWAVFLTDEPWQRRELWTEAGWKWKQGKPPEPFEWEKLKHKRDHPVRYICWYESLAYARWAGKAFLTEAQWEKAARGTDHHQYPWGDEFDESKCNTTESRIRDTTPVGKYSPEGDSPYGCADMAGNVWEWCRNLHIPYPYNAADGREALEGTGGRVLRGGSFSDYSWSTRSMHRIMHGPYARNPNSGVRVGVVAAPSSPDSEL